jgi:hypothetical protein
MVENAKLERKGLSISLSLYLSLSVCQSLSRASPSGASRESEGRRESRERLRRRIVVKGSYPAPSLGLREVYSSSSSLRSHGILTLID